MSQSDKYLFSTAVLDFDLICVFKLTDNKVIVVIGGDDNYKNAAEEEKAVLSRWAKRQISSQFKEEFMDGRISFIFSWNKEHRPIHEEAILHFLDPEKMGKKFEPKLRPSKPVVGTTGARVRSKITPNNQNAYHYFAANRPAKLHICNKRNKAK